MEPSHPVGIVGSRRRNNLPDMKMVYSLVDQLQQEYGGRLVILSGACPRGADSFAASASRAFNVKLQEYPVDKFVQTKWEFTQRAFARNRLIAEKSREIYCLVHQDRTGGTENTIKHALELGTTIYLVNPSGKVYLSRDGEYPACDPVRHLLV